MKKSIIVIFSLSIITLSYGQNKPETKNQKPETKNQKQETKNQKPKNIVLKNALDSFNYALGMSVGNFCKQQGVISLKSDLLLKAVNDVTDPNGKPLFDESQMNQIITGYMNHLKSDKAVANKAAGQKFLAENGKRAGVVTLPSGLQYEVIRAGQDTTHPKPTDKVKCHYKGTLIDGTVFESSYDRNEPATFPVNGVIAGWTEALQLMTPGAKWKLYLPSKLAYGDNQTGPKITPGSTLVFEVELLEIVK